MTIKMPRLLGGLLALSLLAGCSDAPKELARVGDRAITQPQFQAYLQVKRIPQQDEKRRERALDTLIEREALAQQIARTGKLDPLLIEAEVDAFRRQRLISGYFEQYLDDAVTDDAVRNFYAQHADRYQTERVRVAHILLRTNPDMGEAERQAKLSAAHEAYSRIRQGEPFAEVAEALSEDRQSATNGGELGWLQKGAVDPSFSQTMLELEAGDVSEPVMTPFGYHIIKVLDEPQVVKKPLEAVAGEIRYELRQQARQAERERLLEKADIDRPEEK